jgi:hypothetical protein
MPSSARVSRHPDPRARRDSVAIDAIRIVVRARIGNPAPNSPPARDLAPPAARARDPRGDAPSGAKQPT